MGVGVRAHPWMGEGGPGVGVVVAVEVLRKDAWGAVEEEPGRLSSSSGAAEGPWRELTKGADRPDAMGEEGAVHPSYDRAPGREAVVVGVHPPSKVVAVVGVHSGRRAVEAGAAGRWPGGTVCQLSVGTAAQPQSHRAGR